VISTDGTRLAYVEAGDGAPLLLVHGSTADRSRWAPVWPALTAARRVVAMDRRGRGDSGDGAGYSLLCEHEDIRAVAEDLARRAGGPVDVLAHSYGAVCTLGAAAQGAPFRRLALYEPPSTEAVPQPVLARLTELIADGRLDEALSFFLIDVIGRPPEDVDALRGTEGWQRRLAAVCTLPREGAALVELDLRDHARRVRQPVLALLGGASPAWAAAVLRPLMDVLPDARLVVLDGQGHMAIDAAPELLVHHVLGFLGEE
jgi:pimeloyl-ACP methyl ester carboxylesterase